MGCKALIEADANGRRRRAVLGLAALWLAGLPAAPAWAQLSGKTVKIAIPFAPGGAQDVIGRYLATQLATRLSATVIVENKAGAGGVIAADLVAKAPADGTTLLLATGGAISIAPHLRPSLPYQPQQDFAPIGMVADTPMVIAVPVTSTFRTLADLVKGAKAQPERVTYASTGNGSVSHLTGTLFSQAAGIKLTHIPYKGASPALVDLVSGQVAAMVTSATSIEPMVASGKVRVLASFSAAPISALKGVPTVRQAIGLQGLEVPVWVGLMAPAKTPSAVVRKLAAETLAICELPETRQRLRESGAESTCVGSIDFGRLIAEDSQRWKRVIQAGNIQPD